IVKRTHAAFVNPADGAIRTHDPVFDLVVVHIFAREPPGEDLRRALPIFWMNGIRPGAQFAVEALHRQAPDPLEGWADVQDFVRIYREDPHHFGKNIRHRAESLLALP